MEIFCLRRGIAFRYCQVEVFRLPDNVRLLEHPLEERNRAINQSFSVASPADGHDTSLNQR